MHARGKCGDCYFSLVHPSSTPLGRVECHYEAPTASENVDCIWPKPLLTDWCGHFSDRASYERLLRTVDTITCS